MKKRFVLIVSTALLLSACSSKDYFISPDYAGKRIQNVSLIIPTVKEFKIRQTENIFTEDELKNIIKKFVEAISENLKSELGANTSFKKIDFIDINERVSKENVEVPFTRGETIYLNLPKKPLSFAEPDDVYILFFENLALSIYKKERETSDPAKHYTVSTPSPSEAKLSPTKLSDQIFACEVKYAIYDNQLGKPVAYGILTFEDKIAENSDMDKLVKRFVKKIAAAVVNDTPFEK